MNTSINISKLLKYIIHTSLCILCGLLFTVSNTAFAQQEGNIWYFGQNAGIDFNSGAPVALFDGALNTNEGCATICNEDGDLLFYTDGIRVYNNQHLQMPNGFGLHGDPSSTQSGVIVPQPGSDNIYFIFTVDDEAGENGLKYSEVDMNLNGGFGDITTKNVALLTPTSEKITAIRHQNNTDIWVIAHEWDSNAFYSYLVTAAGVNTMPIVTNIGTVHTGGFIPFGNSAGYMKASPQGNKIALAIREMDLFELFDFDNNTGMLSNLVQLPIDIPTSFFNSCYGLEFSPNGQLLYIDVHSSVSYIFQYNLTAADIPSTQLQVGVAPPLGSILGAMQLAPDGKIYIAKQDATNLAVIENPNTLGTGCNFVYNGFSQGNLSKFGLPNFIQTYFQAPPFTYQNLCEGDVTEFTVGSTEGIETVSWNFGDPASGTSNTATGFTASHIFSAPGSYTITMTATSGSLSENYTQTLTIINASDIPALNDIVACSGVSILLNANVNEEEAAYLWDDGTTTSTLSVSTSGVYSVEVTTNCGLITETVNVDFTETPELDLPENLLLCPGESIVLDATSPLAGVTYNWDTGATTPSIAVTESGTYSVEINNICGSASATTTINIIETPTIDLGADVTLCDGESLVIDASPTNLGTTDLTFTWQDGLEAASRTVTTNGTYSVTVTDPCGSYTDEINVNFTPLPSVDFGPDLNLCPGDFYTLDAGIFPGATYLWQDGATSTTYNVTGPGIYNVQIFTDCATVTDEIFIDYGDLPAINLGADQTLCEGDAIVLTANLGDAVNYEWQDGSDGNNFIVTTAGTYSVTATNNCTSVTDEVSVTYYSEPVVNLGSTISLCEGETFTLDVTQTDDDSASYLWQDGSDEPTFTIDGESDWFYVTVSNFCGQRIDSVNSVYLQTPDVNLGQDTTLCTGDFIVLEATAPFASYSWQNGSTLPVQTVTTGGTYWVEVSTACGTVTDTVVVANGVDISVSLGEDVLLCNNETLILDATTPNVDYLWSDGSELPQFIVTNAGTYGITLTNQCETVTDSIVVTTGESPSVQLGEDKFLCDDASLTFDFSSIEATYEWQDGSNNAIYEINNTGTYWVNAFNDCGSDTDTIYLEKAITPTVGFNEAVVNLCREDNDSFTLTPSINTTATYTWNSGETDSILTINSNGLYGIAVSNGCGEDYAEQEVIFNICDCKMLIPTAFSPNGDGINDSFAPTFNCNTTISELSVFDRWGQQVFTTSDILARWNGTANGKTCEVGTYSWYVSFTYEANGNSFTKFKKGNVMLLR